MNWLRRLLPACAVALVAIIAGIMMLSMTTTMTKDNNILFLLSDTMVGGGVVVLRDGTRFPLVSFGLQVYETDAIAYNLTQTAVEVGYRNFLVDTEHQQAFAQAITDSGVARKEIFITGSVPSWNTKQDDEFVENANHASQWTRLGCGKNMAAFAAGNVHMLDQILLDVPPGLPCDLIRGQWRALEEMVQTKQVRTLAVSNFSPRQLDCLLDDTQLKVQPVVNQLPFSVAYHHPAQHVIQENLNKRGVLVQAWSPLGGSAHKFSATITAACADVGKQYGKTFAQVALRWIVQKGAAFVTRTTVREHFVQDLNIFDFELSSKDMTFLDSLAS